MRAFDFDGVVTAGYYPARGDIIITGRCVDEAEVVYEYLQKRVGYLVPVFFNPVMYILRGDKTEAARRHSAQHKISTLCRLFENKVPIESFVEDDALQFNLIAGSLLILYPNFNLRLVS